MRNPVRSETDAFYLAIGGAAFIGAALTLGALVDPIAGVALFVGGIAGAFVWEFVSNDPERRKPFQEAASEGRRTSSEARRRVLVIANRTLGAEELREAVRNRAAGGAELRIVAPILPSRAHYIASDVDEELAEARERLDAALAWAGSRQLDVTGTVGDPNVALGAIEDELRLFGADELIISTFPPGQSNWLETGIVPRLREELDIPITHVVAEGARVEAG